MNENDVLSILVLIANFLTLAYNIFRCTQASNKAKKLKKTNATGFALEYQSLAEELTIINIGALILNIIVLYINFYRVSL